MSLPNDGLAKLSLEGMNSMRGEMHKSMTVMLLMCETLWSTTTRLMKWEMTTTGLLKRLMILSSRKRMVFDSILFDRLFWQVGFGVFVGVETEQMSVFSVACMINAQTPPCMQPTYIQYSTWATGAKDREELLTSSGSSTYVLYSLLARESTIATMVKYRSTLMSTATLHGHLSGPLNSHRLLATCICTNDAHFESLVLMLS